MSETNAKFKRSLARQEQCPVIYKGPTFPEFHGRRCQVNHHPHPGVRHKNDNLLWWTEEEKRAMGFA